MDADEIQEYKNRLIKKKKNKKKKKKKKEIERYNIF